MENNFKRFLSLVVAFVMVFGMFPMNVFAAEGDTDFTDATASEAGAGWAWDNDSKTLTLNGANITSAVTLPEGSNIVVVADTENSIVVEGSVPVTTSGDLTISGTGALTIQAVAAEGASPANTIAGVESITVNATKLTAYGSMGLMARNITISDAQVDIKGYYYGIYNEQLTGSASVNLHNVSGSIVGERNSGIVLYVESNADNDADNMDNAYVDIKDCGNLTISGSATYTATSVWRSGIAVYVLDAETNAYVEIDNSNIDVNGASSGIYVSSHSDNSDADDASAAWISINASNVVATTSTGTWAALFANNSGTGEKATATITLENSNVKALCPNDVGIMTSTVNADSSVIVRESTLELSGVRAGIRVKSNQGEMASASLENSVVIVNSATDYVVDDMDNAASKEGVQNAVSNTNYVAAVDCVITANDDGTWDIPAGGTVNDDGTNYTTTDAYIDTKGNVVERTSYVAEVLETGIKYETLKEAMDAADAIEGDTNVRLLKTWYEELVLVPAGVTFDLNGNVVETKNALSFGVIMDSQENVGGIKIDIDTTEAFTKLQPENGGYLPVYDDRDGVGMYKFFAYTVESSKYGNANEDPSQVYFAARILFDNIAAYEVLANTTNSGVDFVMNMSWTGVTGFGIHYTMSDNNLRNYAAAAYNLLINGEENGKAMSLTVKGVDKLGSGAFISAAPSVETVAEVTASSETMTYDIP